MEIPFKIKTKDGKYIKGLINGSLSKPIIVIVHGLTGNMYEAIHYNAARYFQKAGFTSCRFDLYSGGSDGRQLHECTLKTHGEDFNTIVDFLREKGVKKIFAVGHSYGFPSILSSQNEFITAMTSWDGSVLPRKRWDELMPISKPVKGRILDWGVYSIMGEAMAKEEQELDSIKLAEKISRPIHLITAGKSLNYTGARKIHQVLKSSTKITVIEGADHCFTREGYQNKLYKATTDWFQKFL